MKNKNDMFSHCAATERKDISISILCLLSIFLWIIRESWSLKFQMVGKNRMKVYMPLQVQLV